MLPKLEKPDFSHGFLGKAKTTKKAPYQELDRTPDMYPSGEDSLFITPKNKEDRKRYSDGIKR